MTISNVHKRHPSRSPNNSGAESPHQAFPPRTGHNSSELYTNFAKPQADPTVQLGPIIITVDGTSSSGKSTLAKNLAQQFGLFYMDTGALYRATALLAIERRVPWTDIDQLSRIAGELNIRFEKNPQSGAQEIFLDGRNVTKKLRNKGPDDGSCIVAAIPAVRAALLPI